MDKPQKGIQILVLISSMLLGQLVGILLGLSVSESVSSTISALIGLFTTLTGLYFGSKIIDPNSTNEQVERSILLIKLSYIQVAGFSSFCLIGVLLGLYARTHNLLSPVSKKEVVVSKTDEGTAKKVGSTETVLFSYEACETLSRIEDPEVLMDQLSIYGPEWNDFISNVRSEVQKSKQLPVLKSFIKLNCK